VAAALLLGLRCAAHSLTIQRPVLLALLVCAARARRCRVTPASRSQCCRRSRPRRCGCWCRSPAWPTTWRLTAAMHTRVRARAAAACVCGRACASCLCVRRRCRPSCRR
jgi:hypothetical protein